MKHEFKENYEWNDIKYLEDDLNELEKIRQNIKSDARKDDIDFIINAIEDRIDELRQEDEKDWDISQYPWY